MKPQDLNLPERFKSWRSGQLETAVKIIGSEKYAFLLDAPTGVGKSLVAAAVQRLLGKNVVYLCVTKQLQDQLLHDFPYAKTLKGRINYPCSKYLNQFPEVTADDCTNSKTNKCERISVCPYMVAKRKALSAPLAVLNTAYFLNEANYVGGFADLSLLVIDEFDTIEDQLMNFIELKITKKQLDRFNIQTPKYKTKFESWVEWARVTLVQLKPVLEQLRRSIDKDLWGGIDYRELRRCKSLGRLVGKLEYFAREVDKTWIWYPGEVEWSFKPVWVSKYASKVLWDHTKKVLGMSATILDPRQVCLNTGLSAEGRSYSYLALPSPFPKENRPVYYEPCANVVNREISIALPKLAVAVENILDKHPNDRILCHTVSYEVRNYIRDHVKTKRFITHTPANRAEVLEKFKSSREPLVLLSPSMDRGIDLPDDECRVVVIAKMPYANLGDQQVNSRVYGSKDGSNWYAHKTISTVIQMSGRAVRSSSDHAVTYILDRQFEKLYDDHRLMWPKWFAEAIVF